MIGAAVDWRPRTSDKQGLGLSRRNKHRFAAQEMLVLLAQLAHNLVIWTRNDLAKVDQQFEKYGIQRTVRDALQIPGFVQFNSRGRIKQIIFNENHPFASSIQRAFQAALPMDELSLNLILLANSDKLDIMLEE